MTSAFIVFMLLSCVVCAWGDPHATRHGLLHSPIHLEYATEFQPLVVAEALASTAIYHSAFAEILRLVARNSRVSYPEGLLELQLEIFTNYKLRQAMDYTHGDFQVRDSLLANARDDFVRVMGSWKVASDKLKEKTATTRSIWIEANFQRACEYEGDGHLAKQIRAVATAQITKPFVQHASFPLTTEQFLTLARTIIDSTKQFNQESAAQQTMICKRYAYPRMVSVKIQPMTAPWPQHVGFSEAWFHVPNRMKSQL
ncbi:hypothetical protein N7508_011018 [Penicillium antarcticum]|uniref:uncharacterized protein n=1 Tax=Penicillium antarcticum TaxID=416450 RepID=UPI002389D4E5|nr:uncharacterized protein N7508_011018 [Penicillium antarcticum]KAJ5296197.1 hypothetical protein N7508_011018 [Penicillium antarcticum]